MESGRLLKSWLLVLQFATGNRLLLMPHLAVRVSLTCQMWGDCLALNTCAAMSCRSSMFGIDVLGIDEEGKINDILLFMQPLSAQKEELFKPK